MLGNWVAKLRRSDAWIVQGIKANEVRIRDFGRVVPSTLFTADINEFMSRLSEISAECASYWSNLSIGYPTWDAEL
jgi:hypothetical protein